jgi:hypothetical protein
MLLHNAATTSQGSDPAVDDVSDTAYRLDPTSASGHYRNLTALDRSYVGPQWASVRHCVGWCPATKDKGCRATISFTTTSHSFRMTLTASRVPLSTTPLHCSQRSCEKLLCRSSCVPNVKDGFVASRGARDNALVLSGASRARGSHGPRKSHFSCQNHHISWLTTQHHRSPITQNSSSLPFCYD